MDAILPTSLILMSNCGIYAGGCVRGIKIKEREGVITCLKRVGEVLMILLKPWDKIDKGRDSLKRR